MKPTPPQLTMATPPTVPQFKTQFNHSPASERDLVCKLPSLTSQDFKDEADIVVLCNRYQEKGYYYNPLLAVKQERRKPQFGDFSALPDIAQAMDTVARAQEMFMRLPAEVREACGHDPAAFVALQRDPAMQELLRKYGLVSDKSGVQGIKSPAIAPGIPAGNPGGVPNPPTDPTPVPAPNPAL